MWTNLESDWQWRRFVVKFLNVRGHSRSARSSHQTVSDYTLRQWFPDFHKHSTISVTDSWPAHAGASKSKNYASLSFILDDMKHMQSYPTRVFEWRKMWHFMESKRTLTYLSYILSGVKNLLTSGISLATDCSKHCWRVEEATVSFCSLTWTIFPTFAVELLNMVWKLESSTWQ